MEERPPGGDCASGEGDPPKSDNPPASWTPSPVGEQAQGESERSQLRICLLVSYPAPSAILYRARRKGSGNIGIQFLYEEAESPMNNRIITCINAYAERWDVRWAGGGTMSSRSTARPS